MTNAMTLQFQSSGRLEHIRPDFVPVANKDSEHSRLSLDRLSPSLNSNPKSSLYPSTTLAT